MENLRSIENGTAEIAIGTLDRSGARYTRRERRRSARFPQGLPVFMPLEVVGEPDTVPADRAENDAVLAFGRMGPDGESFAMRLPTWGSAVPDAGLLGACAVACEDDESIAPAGPPALCVFVPLVRFRDRAAGLLKDRKGRRLGPLPEDLAAGEDAVPGAVCLAPCGSIHTFLMKEAIDVAFISREGVVLRSERALVPRRLRSCRGAALVLERPASDAPWPEAGDELTMAAGWK